MLGCSNRIAVTEKAEQAQFDTDQTKAPSQGGKANVEAPADACAVMCRHSRRLGCAGLSHCGESCSRLVALTDCAMEMAAALGCFTKEGDDHWECGEDGLAAIRDGYCEREQAAYVACLQRSEK